MPSSLLDRLVAHMRGRSASPELHLAAEARKYKAADYRAACASATAESIEWIRSWWREDGDELKSTDLCFPSGQQRFIHMARELAESLDPSQSEKAAVRVRGKFDEALFGGSWLYEDATQS